MDWRGSRAASRNRYVAKYDAAEVDRYDRWILQLTREDDEACLSDLRRVFQFQAGMAVLDAGTGTGAFCKILKDVPGLSITALDPSPVMLAKLRSKTELADVTTVEGFCDGPEDRQLFREAQFQAIVSRQLVNGLFDPLTAFSNWHHWLSPGGAVVVLDGLFDRSAWTGVWQEEVDVLPISACGTTALTPYLLELAGFRVEAVEWMEATNEMPTTKTKRYMVVATKPA